MKRKFKIYFEIHRLFGFFQNQSFKKNKGGIVIITQNNEGRYLT